MRIENLTDLHMHFPDFDGYWDTDDLFSIEERIRSLLPPADQSYTSKDIENLTQLSRVLCLQGKMPEAATTLDLCEQKIGNLDDADKKRVEIRLALEKGRYFCFFKSPARALDSLKTAWLLAEKAKLPVFLIETAFLFSLTLPQKQSHEWLLRSIELTKSAEGDAKKWLPVLLMAEAWRQYDAHQFQLALETFEAALKWFDDKEKKGLYWNLKWCEARILRALKKPEMALKIQEVLLTRVEQMGSASGSAYWEIAECWEDLNDSEKSQPYFQLAYEALNKNVWFADNFAHELTRIQKKAKKSNF